MVKKGIEKQGKLDSIRYDIRSNADSCAASDPEINIDPKLVKRIKSFIRKNNVSEDNAKEIFNDDLIEAVLSKKDSVPIEIFCNKELGAFESIVKYLKENMFKSFSEISSITERSVKTVWTAYHKSKMKMPSAYLMHHTKGKDDISRMPEVPLSVFRNRTLGVQENLVIYLKDDSGLGLSFHDIAAALKRDDRTVWTAYHRAKKKAGEIA